MTVTRRLAALLAAAGVAGLLVGCSASPAAPAPVVSASPSGAATPAGSASTTTCAYRTSGRPAKPVQLPPATGVPRTGSTAFALKTDQGVVTVTMDRSATPCTVNSFASLARQGYFDGTRCHRLTTAGIFVLQCGDPTGTGSGGPGYAFDDELQGREHYTQGVVAMANKGPNTNGSQFFLIWKDSTAVLDQNPSYTVFGRMDAASVGVVAKIAARGEDGSTSAGDGKPVDPAEIISVTTR